MFSSQEILELLKSSPSGYLDPHHDFFKESNLNLIPTYKKLGSISCKDDETFDESNCDFQNKIFCNAFGCSEAFNSTTSYQSHYNAVHRFKCRECKKSFPTEYFLDLHISENHDSFFMARLERGDRLYKCYLEECQDVFGNPHERRTHCLEHHKFPINFRFDKMTHNTSLKKDKSEQYKMQVDEESTTSANNKSHKFENFSFGKQKEPAWPKNSRKALDNMKTLSQVLDTI